MDDAVDTTSSADARPLGCWLVHFHDWSEAAVFDDELEALRFTVKNRMESCRWVAWGEPLREGE